MEQVRALGIDLATQVFHLVGVNCEGEVVLKRQLRRARLAEFMVRLPPCTVYMEACGGAHHWGRKFASYGHEPKIIAAQFVKPFRKGSKNDFNDAEAIVIAGRQPQMRFVSLKTVEQQDIQALHRIRSQAIVSRTALSNQIGSLLREYGVVLPRGRLALRSLAGVLEDGDNELSDLMRGALCEMHRQWLDIHDRVAELTSQLKRLARHDERCVRLQRIEGIGPLTASALIAAVGDGRQFKRGRQLAAWAGLVPRQHTTGGRPRLYGITKNGNPYLRQLFIHGARSLIRRVAGKSDPRSRWIQALIERRGKNKAIVAIANKNARIAWAVLSKQAEYRPA